MILTSKDLKSVNTTKISTLYYVTIRVAAAKTLQEALHVMLICLNSN